MPDDDLIRAIQTEDEIKSRLAKIFDAARVDAEYDRLIDRRRGNVLKTAGSVLTVIGEIQTYEEIGPSEPSKTEIPAEHVDTIRKMAREKK